MTIRTLIMDKPGSSRYARLGRVLQRSVEAVMPTHTKFQATTTVAPQPAHKPYKPNVHAFREKLRAWSKTVQTAPEPVWLVDCDMLMVNPLETIPDCNIAFTWHDNGMPPVNTGAVYVTPGAEARAFFRTWLEVYEDMLNDWDLYVRWADEWAGGDQAALGYLLSGLSKDDWGITAVPCREYNATQYEWETMNTDTVRLIHIKSDLRKLCLGETKRMRAPATPRMEEVARRWRHYDRER